MSERKFKWELWIDPLGRNLADVHMPGFDDIAPGDTYDGINFMDFSQSNVAVEDGDASYEDIDWAGSKYHTIHPIKVMQTKLGLLTIVESSVANYHFDFWKLHSNEQFTDADAKVIMAARGVEVFTPLTRYSIRIGFPKSGLIDITQAKLDIEKQLKEAYLTYTSTNEVSFPDEVEDKISKKVSELRKKGGHWILYVLPNGEMEIYESDIVGKAFKGKLQLFEQTKNLAGGKVLKS